MNIINCTEKQINWVDVLQRRRCVFPWWRAFDGVWRVCCEPVKASVSAQDGGAQQTGRIPLRCSEVTSVVKKKQKKSPRRRHGGVRLHDVRQGENRQQQQINQHISESKKDTK